MSSKLGRNFRKGHLAEDLGNLFLRSFCAVSEVRQEDDYGIDSIATLLKPNKNLLHAEKTFSVQIKSSSVKEVKYKGKEIEWLLKQEIPFFFCSVDLNTNNFELFTINPVFKYMAFISVEEIRDLILVLSENPNLGNFKMSFIVNDEGEIVEMRDENDKPIKDNDEPIKVYLGPPILKANLLDTTNDEFLEKIYYLMKSWLDLEYELTRLRKIDMTYLAFWKTWENPTHGPSFQSVADLTRDMNVASDYIERLASYLSLSKEEDKKIILAMNELENWFGKNGISISCIYGQ